MMTMGGPTTEAVVSEQDYERGGSGNGKVRGGWLFGLSPLGVCS